MIGTIIKTLLLRSASWGLGAWLAPLGKLAIGGVLVAGGYLYWAHAKIQEGVSLQIAKQERVDTKAKAVATKARAKVGKTKLEKNDGFRTD